MDYLQGNPDEAIKEFGEDDPFVGDIRNQNAARESGKSAQEMYIEGMSKRNPKIKG
jgi:hypothetical protein